MIFPGRHRQRGLTFIEYGMGLTIAILTVGAALIGYNSVMTSSKVNQLLLDITTMRKAINELYHVKSDFEDLTDTLLVDHGVLPERLVAYHGHPQHAFGGGLYPLPYGFECPGCEDGFRIFARKLPERACAGVLGNDWGRGLELIRVGEEGQSYTTVSTDLSIEDINDHCSSSSGNLFKILLAMKY